METFLKIAGELLGILIPFLFVATLNKGIKRTDFDEHLKTKYRRILVAIVVLGTVCVWALSLSKILDYHVGDLVPRFVLPLLGFVLIGLAISNNKDFQTILSLTPLSALVGVQVFRLAGLAFFLIAYLHILPTSFQLGGYGDLLTGILAILTSRAIQNRSNNARLLFWMFNIVGLLDLLNVAVLLLLYYPSWNFTMPTTESATQFSLVMIPAIAAPFAMLLHIYSIIVVLKVNPAEKIPF
jgi:hypothetical protein